MRNFFSKEKLSGKGFAAAVAACLVIVGGAGIYSYNKVADKLNDQLIGSTKTVSDDASVTEAPVNAEQTGVAKTEPAVTEPEKAESEPAKAAEVPISEPDIEVSAVPQAIVRPLNGEVINAFSQGELVKSSTLNVWKPTTA